MKEQYRTVKGWSGKKYRVYMSQAEIDAREKIKLWVGVSILTPVWVVIMAIAAGLI